MPRMVEGLVNAALAQPMLQRSLGLDAEDRQQRHHRHAPAPVLQRSLGLDAEDRSQKWGASADCPSCFNGASASMPRIGGDGGRAGAA